MAEMVKTVTLPSREEIMRRLSGADQDAHRRARLFPLIAEKGRGQKLSATGVATLIGSAIGEYRLNLHLSVARQLGMWIPVYIGVLVNNKEVCAAAIDEFNRLYP